jgi:hypothetical protein
MPHLTGKRADQAAAAERHKNKTLLTSQLPGKTGAYMPTPGLDAGGATPELKLRLKCYCS